MRSDFPGPMGPPMPMLFQALDLTEAKLLVIEVPADVVRDVENMQRMAVQFREAIKQLCRIEVQLVLLQEGVKLTALDDEQLEAFGLQRIRG